MDIDQFDTDSIKNTKKTNRKYSQSSQSSISGVNPSTATICNSDKNDGSSTTASTSKSAGLQECDIIDRSNWKHSGNSTILNKTSFSNLSCNHDNSTIDSTLISDCDSGNSTVNKPTSSAPDTRTDIKVEIKEEIDDSGNLNTDVDIGNLPPHAVSKFYVG